MKKAILLVAAVAALLGPAHAVTFVGATANNELVTFDSASPGSIVSRVSITGLVGADGVTLDPGATLVNLSFNPADGLHYGLDSNANFYRVSLDGSVTLVSNAFNPTAFTAGFAYDPFTNRFLFASEDGESVLLSTSGSTTANPTLKYATGDVNAAFTPQVFALGIDAVTGQSYFLDANRGVLAISVDPNFSELFTVGSLGGSFAAFGGAVVDEDGFLYASLSTDGLTSGLYSIDTSTGAATLVGSLGEGVYSLAAVPEPGTIALIGIGLAGALIFRRRRPQA